jgi:Uncharacterized protein conserved in bacteria (DUF2188)
MCKENAKERLWHCGFEFIAPGTDDVQLERKGAIMARGFIHTVYKNEQWINEVEEGSTFGGPHSTKEEAVAAGRTRAQQDKTEHVIHNQDGTISERKSYGLDPASRVG